jgi:subtilisin family serine protease
MLVCDPAVLGRVSAFVRRLGGSERYVDHLVGYMRLELPIENLATLVADPSIEAYQVASLSMASWMKDGPLPRENAEADRKMNTNPAVPITSTASDVRLPILNATTAQQAGYTADQDMGIEKWMHEHPTFDGRGVTIAFIEGGQLEFSHPIMGPARTLEGQAIDKLAGILNAIDPTEQDPTRVDLPTELDTTGTWIPIGGRTFILPRSGKYRFGVFSIEVGDNLVQQFGVLRSRTTDEIWVDTDGDGDFRNEQSVLGLERKFEVRYLKLTQPQKAQLNFVVTIGATPATVYIYSAHSGHQAMTVSVAAGSRNLEGLAYGVAPAARIVLVRALNELRPADFIEGVLAAAARPDVDILCDSFAMKLLPETERDFAGVVFRRIVSAYKKPVFHSAGNERLRFSSVFARGDAFSVGGTISPATFAAFYGGERLPAIVVHPLSAAGPALDGALKPDFLAPMERISARLCRESDGIVLPKNQPTYRLPPCYGISNGTSSSSPYAAGIAALLISAAKQAGVDYSVENLARALRASARFLPDVSAYQQGTGLLDLAGAWDELQRGIANARIVITGENHHVLTPYSAGGSQGAGLFEAEGWTVGSTGLRTLRLRRDAGPSAPTKYRLSWTGNDGTFATQRSIVLALGETVSLPLTIVPRSLGAHSAILNLHEPVTDAIVVRSLASIVVPERFEPPRFTARFEGRLPLMRTASHFLEVPVHTAALSFELTVTHGSVGTIIVPSLGIEPKLYMNKTPRSIFRTLPNGTYHFVIANPSPGTWSFNVSNESAWNEPDSTLVSTQEAQYSLEVRALDVLITANGTDKEGTLIVNRGATIAEPVLKESSGTITSQHTIFSPDGQANRFDIQVPIDSAALIVNARTLAGAARSRLLTRDLELYLYDCTTGECFSEDFALPAAQQQQLVIRNPHPGRWVAMVNGAPSFPATGSFVIEAIVVAERGSKTISLRTALPYGSQRTVPPDAQGDWPFANSVRVYELFDEAAERSETQQSWVIRPDVDKLTGRPSALGITYSKRGPSNRSPPVVR